MLLYALTNGAAGGNTPDDPATTVDEGSWTKVR